MQNNHIGKCDTKGSHYQHETCKDTLKILQQSSKQTVINAVEMQSNHTDKSDTEAHLVSDTESSHYQHQTCEDTLKTYT